MIYTVLPVYADEFGLTLPWVDNLLSADRFVRLFAYCVIALMSAAIGVRRICVAVAVIAKVSIALCDLG